MSTAAETSSTQVSLLQADQSVYLFYVYNFYYNYDEATVGLYFSYFKEISVESPLPGSRVDRRATQSAIYS